MDRVMIPKKIANCTHKYILYIHIIIYIYVI